VGSDMCIRDIALLLPTFGHLRLTRFYDLAAPP
jgi:hypothetical protein